MSSSAAGSASAGGAAVGLDQLRGEIDRIDDQLLALIEQRLSTAKAIAELKRSTANSMLLLRPDRERQLLDRLSSKSSLPRPVVEAIWREIMACSLQLQQVTELAIHAAERPIDVTNLARLRFGCAAPVHVAASAHEALERARVRPSIAVIEVQPISGWWTALAGDDSVAIFDWLADEDEQAVGLLVGRCDPSCRLPDLSFPILTAAALGERLAGGEKIRPIAESGQWRLCVSRR